MLCTILYVFQIEYTQIEKNCNAWLEEFYFRIQKKIQKEKLLSIV